jgi:hypothetical protein
MSTQSAQHADPAVPTKKPPQSSQQMNAVGRHRARNRALGLCRYCPNKAADGRTACQGHLDKRRAIERAAYPARKAMKKALGLCLFCSERGYGAETLLCVKHRSLSRRYQGTADIDPSLSEPMLRYPFVRSWDQCADGLDLLLAINRAVPIRLEESVRAEVCQDLAVAILDGSVCLQEISTLVPAFVKAVYRKFPVRFGPLSLDQEMFREGGRMRHEFLAAPQ